MTDWYAWHQPYDDPDSPLSRRLRLVQRHIAQWLDERTDDSLSVVSVCAGQGRDLLDLLTARPDAGRVRARLIEYDDRNASIAGAAIEAARLANVTVLRGDAGDLASYVGAVPADLVLLAGVLGNVTDADVRTTIEALPQLCAAGATVIWTRSPRPPDLTPAIRQWLGTAGFIEQDFHVSDDGRFSVGVHRFAGDPQPLDPRRRVFRFVR